MYRSSMMLFLLIVLISFSSACGKEKETTRYITLRYTETQCADPWMKSAADSTTLRHVARYLDSAGVYVAGLGFEPSRGNGVFCAACTCPSGRIIWATTLEGDSTRARYGRLGFR